MEELFRNRRILICVGSGGVGKTTVSASLGLLAAKSGRRVLVLTIDPSHRLKVTLGLKDNSFCATHVPIPGASGRLDALLLNAEEIFKEFIVQASHRTELADRLLRNRLYQQLSTTLSGSQEFTSLLQLSRMVSDSSYDLIILDTPPAQHAIDFLEAPQKIHALFQENIVKWFLSNDAEVGFMRRVVSKGTLTVLSAFEKITGSVFMAELKDFFESVRAVQAKISEKTAAVQQILVDRTTGFVLVTGFDASKLEEADQLFRYLNENSYVSSAAIINRAFPLWFDRNEGASGGQLGNEYENWSRYHREREEVLTGFVKKWSEELPTVRIPDLNKELNGIQGLEVMAHEMEVAFTHGRDYGMRSS